MTIRKTKYVAASDINEAWLRFRAGLYTEDREDSLIRADEKNADDECEPPCKFTVYEVHVDIHVDDGPETECSEGDHPSMCGPDCKGPMCACDWSEAFRSFL